MIIGLSFLLPLTVILEPRSCGEAAHCPLCCSKMPGCKAPDFRGARRTWLRTLS